MLISGKRFIRLFYNGESILLMNYNGFKNDLLEPF